MAKHWRYFIFLLWISYLMMSGILLFTRGFLLSRDAFTDVSTCILQSDLPCTQFTASSNNITKGEEYHCLKENTLSSLLHNIDKASKVCFPARAKVILLIVDALRYDFTTYNSALTNPMAYENNLPIMHQILNDYPENARLYKFIADPPTTTMQRLKALTTGSLPTFIDAGSNFATPEINEDNIIDQMIHHNKNVVFMGDDTWSGLYPNRFIRNWPFPSFNVWDLDTVDYGIIDNIYTEIPKTDWQLLIGHFLGVDHAGHRYGPYHKEMKRKLGEINNIVKNTVDTMDDNTMLFVIGDHGMTKTGDHGGESEAEVTAAMFVFSKLPLNSFDSVDSIKQISLIPTLATILGIPIPFSNLGTIVINSIPILDNKTTDFSNWQSSLVALWANIQQITNYIKTYSERATQFSKESVELLEKKYSKLYEKVNNIDNEEEFKKFAKEAKEYLQLMREMCEEVWVQFDSFSMSRGLLLLFLTLFFVYLIVDGIPMDKLSNIFKSSFIFCSYIAMFIVSLITIACYYLSLIENLELNLYFSTGMISVFLLAILVIQHWEDISINWYESTKIRNWIDAVCRIFLLLILCSLFSNSYILEEASVFSYLLISLVVFIIYNMCTSHQNSNTKSYDKVNLNVFKFKWNSVKLKLVLLGVTFGILIRTSMKYWRCREDQKWCINLETEKLLETGKSIGTTDCVISLIILAVFATVIRIWLRSCGNLVGFSPTVMFARYAPSVIVVCTGGFWILNRLPKETKNRIITPWQTDVLAWIVYSLTLISIFCAVLQPLCVYVLPKNKESVSVYGQENIIPQLYKHMKESLEEKRRNFNGTKDKPIVCGLATVYSALYVIISVFISLLMALLLGNRLAPSSVIMYFATAIVLAILSIIQYEKSTNVLQMLKIPNSSLLCWVLLAHYFFYGTGHQPSLPTIQWEAAFVGTGGAFIHNIIPAALIGFNTFCSYIFFGITLPLLLIIPFTIYVMFPSLCNKQNPKNMTKGELIIYENEDMIFNSLFTVICKYLMYHGIRMFACMLAATIHCHHLMTWKVFAPKFIFEAVGLMVTIPSVLFGYLLFIRINNRVNMLVIGLEKRNS